MSLRSARALVAALAQGTGGGTAARRGGPAGSGPGARRGGAVTLGARRGGAALLCDSRVVAEAGRQGVLPVVADLAVRRGVVPDLPAAVALAVGDRVTGLSPTAALLVALERNRAMASDLAELERRARAAAPDIPMIALKGAAIRRHPIWPDPGVRPRRDVDLWLPGEGRLPGEDCLAAATRGMLAAGFAPVTDLATSARWADDHHDAPLTADGLRGSVELHRHPTIAAVRAVCPPLEVVPGADGPQLTPRSLLVHVIVHAQLQDFAHRLCRLPLIALLDVAYALAAGVVTEDELRGYAGPALRRPVDFHLYCARRLRGNAGPARGPVRPALWLRWHVALVLLGAPRAAALEREVLLAPTALSRSAMERRAGGRLGRRALWLHRLRFVRDRGPAALWRVTAPAGHRRRPGPRAR